MGTSLMVTDELINLAQIGIKTYQFPPWTSNVIVPLWTAWELAFSGIVSGSLLSLVAIGWKVQH